MRKDRQYRADSVVNKREVLSDLKIDLHSFWLTLCSRERESERERQRERERERDREREKSSKPS